MCIRDRNYTVLLDYTVNEIILDPEYAFENQTIIPMSCEKLPVIEVEAANRTCLLYTSPNHCACTMGFGLQYMSDRIGERSGKSGHRE